MSVESMALVGAGKGHSIYKIASGMDTCIDGVWWC